MKPQSPPVLFAIPIPLPPFSPSTLEAPELELIILATAAVHFRLVAERDAFEHVVRRLKRAIDANRISGAQRFQPNGLAYKHTIVSLDSLWKFAQKHGHEPQLKWLRPLCLKWSEVSGVTLQESYARATIGAESECRAELCRMMRSGPPQKKDKVRELLMARYRIGWRSFDRAWANAINDAGAAGWKKSGPKRYS